MNEPELQNRTALVTGGSRGIGRACCEQLAAAGAKVAVNYRSNADAAREVVARITAAGGQAILCQADVSSPEQVQNMIAQVEEELGPVELLVNNAGVFDFVSHEQTSLEIWERMLNVNLTGCYLTIWAVKEDMIRRGFGRIVNISSIAGLAPRPMSIAYSVSKAGVVSLTKSLAVAIAEHNVRVNAVAPGIIVTRMTTQLIARRGNSVTDGTIIGRLGEPEEVAHLIAFLCSGGASYINGQIIGVDGGTVLR